MKHCFPPLVLGSSSVYRASLLQQLGLAFEQASPNIDESIVEGESAYDLAARLSAQKAHSVAKHFSQYLVIASDQVACLQENGADGQIFGKPGNENAAIEQLSACSGKRVRFYTGLHLYNASNDMHWAKVESFEVQFRTLSQSQIRTYIEREQPLDCAGSFKVEGLGIALFEGFGGRDYNALIGLPLIALVDGLKCFGVEVL